MPPDSTQFPAVMDRLNGPSVHHVLQLAGWHAIERSVAFPRFSRIGLRVIGGVDRGVKHSPNRICFRQTTAEIGKVFDLASKIFR